MNSREFAISMELDGGKYYREQAEKNHDNSLRIVFLMLAEDEDNHAKALQKRRDQQAYDLMENNIIAKSQSIFAGIGDLKTVMRVQPNQLDVYRAALEMEKKSITLYQELLSQATDDQDKALFEHLIKQEKDHFAVLDELVEHVGRPEQWVESAEFGRRKDY